MPCLKVDGIKFNGNNDGTYTAPNGDILGGFFSCLEYAASCRELEAEIITDF